MSKTRMITLLAIIALPATPAHGREGPNHPVEFARGGHALPETNVQAGERLARRAGWFGEQWSCLYALWNRESGWQTIDPNPTSDADGIPQANPASKMGPGWEYHPAQQIRWGLGYIRARYGSPCAAWAHSNAYGFY